MAWWILFPLGLVALVMLALLGITMSRRSAPPALGPASSVPPLILGEALQAPGDGAGSASLPVVTEPPEISALRLTRESQLDPALREQLASHLRELAVPSLGLRRLVSADVENASGSSELADLVISEPRLAARVLIQANSAFHGPRSPVKSIPHAITYLGAPSVRNMALTMLLSDVLPPGEGEHKLYLERTWSAALVAAELCSLLGTKLRLPGRAELSTHAILSFVGEVALPAIPGSQPDLAGERGLLERHRLDQQSIGVSTILLGSLLMQEWRLPRSMISEVEAVGRLLVTPVNRRDPRRSAQRALVFACARMGEMIARGQVDHPSGLSLGPDAGPEFHHLQQYLQLPDLARLEELIRSAEVQIVLARMIDSSQQSAGRS